MTDAFGLSSSAGYAFMAQEKGWIVHGTPVRGDILIHDKYNNAFASNGDRGHTEVFSHIDNRGMWVSFGSAGGTDGENHHRGVDTHHRDPSFWCMIIRVPGVTDERFAVAVKWIQDHWWVGYDSSNDDVDHDGSPDRVDLDDGNGIDCSAAVYLLFQAMWSAHPGPPVMTAEEIAMLVAYLKEQEVEHGLFAADAEDDDGRAINMDRYGSIWIEGTPDGSVNGSKWAPGEDVFRKIRLARGRTHRPVAGYAIDLNGVWWPWSEKGGAMPPTRQVHTLPPGAIVKFPIGT